MRITVALFCLLVAGSASAQEAHVLPGSRPDAEVRNASSVADTSNIAADTSNLWSRYLEAERWAASSDRRSHRTAAQEYLDVLRLLSKRPLNEDLRPDIVSRLVTRIVEPLLWIGALSEEDLGPEGLPHDVWPLLEHWWRQTDPMPATVLNERLIEHLRRVAFAAETYADAQGSVDDRGKLYVRLGRPSHR
ncbi:MAG: GWxTD domain-containing protein, partial [Bacteroidota bacterium]